MFFYKKWQQLLYNANNAIQVKRIKCKFGCLFTAIVLTFASAPTGKR